MSDPCTNTERFAKLESAVDEIRTNTKASADEGKALSAEMRSTLTVIRESMIRDNERLGGQRKEIEVLFQNQRQFKDQLLPAIKEDISQARAAAEVRVQGLEQAVGKRLSTIEIKHLKEEGGAAAFRDIRVIIPSLIAVVLGMLKLSEEITRWINR